jgi:hypothetical protein
MMIRSTTSQKSLPAASLCRAALFPHRRGGIPSGGDPAGRSSAAKKHRIALSPSLSDPEGTKVSWVAR